VLTYPYLDAGTQRQTLALTGEATGSNPVRDTIRSLELACSVSKAGQVKTIDTTTGSVIILLICH